MTAVPDAPELTIPDTVEELLAAVDAARDVPCEAFVHKLFGTGPATVRALLRCPGCGDQGARALCQGCLDHHRRIHVVCTKCDWDGRGALTVVAVDPIRPAS